MTDFNTKEISTRIQTPAYVFDEGEFHARIDQVQEAFGSDIDLCYSIKANPFLLEFLSDDIAKIEVCSPGELEICIAMKIDPARIIYSGVHKETSDISRAISYGVKIITAESHSHLRDIQTCAGNIGTTVDILLRVSDNSQFGIDREELISLIQEYREDPNMEIVGLHYFTGTQKTGARHIVRELDFIDEYIQRIKRETGLDIERVEYGTGLGVEYFADKKNQGDPIEADRIEADLLSEISPALKALAAKVDLTVEMGRFFASSCGHYFTGIVDTKINDGIGYAIIDGGSHQIRYYGHMQGMQLPFITCLSDHDNAGGDDSTWTICGSLCTTADVLARNAELGHVEPGDVLVFHKTGAYSIYESMTCFLSRDMAKIYTLSRGGELALCRDRIDTYLFNYRNPQT